MGYLGLYGGNLEHKTVQHNEALNGYDIGSLSLAPRKPSPSHLDRSCTTHIPHSEVQSTYTSS